MSIYKPCDIRGHATEDLTPGLYRSWGRTLGCRVPPRAKFVVGGDMRDSTPAFRSALLAGLCEAGADAVDLGLLPTPMVYYARRRLRAAGCAIVTASHNAAQLNGLKWMIGDQPPSPEDVALLRDEAERLDEPLPGREQSKPRTLDVSFDYVAWLQETWADAMSVQRRVVLDPMHGCQGLRARRYLQAVFPRCLFSAIHDEPDARFAGRCPDCSRPHLLEALCNAVYQQGAHLGIAFDGDGDRMALVDDEAVPLTAEEAAWCLLQSCGSRLRGERFVYDIKFSDRVPDAARRLGAEPLVERSGHAFIRHRMMQTGALLGAEISGHYFFRVLEGGDDALFTVCWLIAYLGRTGDRLSSVRRRCPGVFITPDLRVSVAQRNQRAVIERVRSVWSQYPQSTVDGVRVDFPDGWALIRSSVTEPALTFRFEAVDWPQLHRLVERFCDALPALGDQLRCRYEAAVGNRS